MTILAIGPRELPKADTVEMWFDAGSGTTGQRVMVPVQRLTLSDRDRGEGVNALYEYESYDCRRRPEHPASRSPGHCARAP